LINSRKRSCSISATNFPFFISAFTICTDSCKIITNLSVTIINKRNFELKKGKNRWTRKR
uniref:Ovule protein n=1 Tax=Brugia timori TaxID=42155 RepID=A0A0R3R514_9BILA